MKQYFLLFSLICFSGFTCILFADSDPSQFIAHPTSNNLFNDCMSQNGSNFDLMVTPLAAPAGQFETNTFTPLPANDVLSSDPIHSLDAFLNNNVIKQMGVGVQVHF